MQNFLKIASGINILPLQLELMRNQHLFGEHKQRADSYGSPHSGMEDIWVRYNAIENFGPSFNDEHDSIWYPAYNDLPALRPIIFGLMSQVQGERLGGVLITKLPPGGEILPHIDRGWHAEYYDKYFIPVQNDAGAIFGFEDGVIEPSSGEIYWFSNKNLHWVKNDSKRDRISLIVCIKSKNGG